MTIMKLNVAARIDGPGSVPSDTAARRLWTGPARQRAKRLGPVTITPRNLSRVEIFLVGIIYPNPFWSLPRYAPGQQPAEQNAAVSNPVGLDTVRMQAPGLAQRLEHEPRNGN